MLEKLKILLGITDDSKDQLLELIIDKAKTSIINYTHNQACITKPEVEPIILDLAVINYNRIGTEGLDSESFSGVSYHYSADIPDILKSQLISFRKLRVL